MERSSRRTASAAAAGPSDSAAGPSAEPAELRFLDLPPELIAEVLALVTTADRLRVRCVNKACKSTHAKAGDAVADGLAVERIGALVAARGRETVAAGAYHTVLLRPADGVALSCGGGGLGHLGLHHLGQGQGSGLPLRLPVPAPVAGLDGGVVREVAAGSVHTLLLGACGGVWSCGTGGFGKLGHGERASLATPRRIGGLEQVRAVQVAAGGAYSLVLSAAGHVYSFGDGKYGRLGHDDQADQPLPRRISALLDTRVCQLT